ncbi:transposase [Meiothermus sp.]|uniref:transposase n=1 Tax=Meiothermus sp. TaxID=1955249 RepID=UPI00307F4D50
MTYNPQQHHRRSIRLKGYDYTQAGAYFITICTHDRECLFGEVVDGKMRLNTAGTIIRQCWLDIPHHFPAAKLDEFVIMPNHVHGILVLAEWHVGARHAVPLQPQIERFGKPRAHSISTIVRSFKSAATKRVNEYRGIPGMPLWQRNYYEHTIRDMESLNRIREYIVNNPLQWLLDRENPDFVPARRAASHPKDEPWRL